MLNENKSTRKSFVFIGFMGVGKTTVAKRVAQRLSRDFIDIDAEIEKEFGMRTTEIFKKIGEQAFRAKEKEYVLHYIKQPEKIISLGGGAFLQEDIREACLDNTIVFYLDISWESWRKRLHILIDSRPVLQNKSNREIRALFEARKETYKYHHVRIMTDAMNQDKIASKVIEAFNH